MDARLLHAINTWGTVNWADVSDFVGVHRWTCRSRWLNYHQKLNVSEWTDDEDRGILDGVDVMGRKWTEISRQLGTGRTAKAVQNRYESLIKKKQVKDETIAQIAKSMERDSAFKEEEDPQEESDWQDEIW
jgi:hypothetical protein